MLFVPGTVLAPEHHPNAAEGPEGSCLLVKFTRDPRERDFADQKQRSETCQEQ